MNPHGDILDDQDSVSRPLAGSLALHAGVVAFFFAFSWWSQHNSIQFGADKNLGGAIGVGVVDKIPLPNRNGRENKVANDTTSQVPQPPQPKVQPKKVAPPPDSDAIPVKGKRTPVRQSQIAATNQRYEPRPPEPNQLYSQTGARAQSPLYGMTGVGGVGIGSDTLGRCGGYLTALQQAILMKWSADPSSNMITRPVIISMTVERDGKLLDNAVSQTSGNYNIDTAAQRAVIAAAPFQPFLATCGNFPSAKIQVVFEPRK